MDRQCYQYFDSSLILSSMPDSEVLSSDVDKTKLFHT